MRKIIIIGTFHTGLTPNKELKEVLEEIKPDQLLVEITEREIKNDNLRKYLPEMVFAYRWAKKKKIAVSGFDSSINVLSKGMTEKDNKSIIKKQKKLMRGYTWKDFNKEKYLKLLEGSEEDLIDWKKEQRREKKMLQNIKKAMHSNGIIVIVTGCGHLKFFKKHIKRAVFPFR
mgnify:CR=1 FL=1